MTTIFVSGSRHIFKLNDMIRQRLRNVIEQQYSIIIGDANGADKAVQTFLADHQYQNVKIFCSGNTCRNNIGNWDIIHIDIDSKLKGRDFYTQKDIEMAKQANYGFVLWDGKSKGSYNNILELLKKEKKALVYYAPDNQFYTISKEEDLHKLCSKCDPKPVYTVMRQAKHNPIVHSKQNTVQEIINF